MEKAAAVSGVLLDPVALQDVHKASEVCHYVCMCVWDVGHGHLCVAVNFLINIFNKYHRSICDE